MIITKNLLHLSTPFPSYPLPPNRFLTSNASPNILCHLDLPAFPSSVTNIQRLICLLTSPASSTNLQPPLTPPLPHLLCLYHQPQRLLRLLTPSASSASSPPLPLPPTSSLLRHLYFPTSYASITSLSSSFASSAPAPPLPPHLPSLRHKHPASSDILCHLHLPSPTFVTTSSASSPPHLPCLRYQPPAPPPTSSATSTSLPPLPLSATSSASSPCLLHHQPPVPPPTSSATSTFLFLLPLSPTSSEIHDGHNFQVVLDIVHNLLFLSVFSSLVKL